MYILYKNICFCVHFVLIFVQEPNKQNNSRMIFAKKTIHYLNELGTDKIVTEIYFKIFGFTIYKSVTYTQDI